MAIYNSEQQNKEQLSKIYKYCAYRERSHSEVRSKLYEYGLPSTEVEEIIVHLIQHDFLNEERYARSLARGKFIHNKWGRNKILLQLKKQKVSEYCIKKALTEIDEELYDAQLKDLILQYSKKVKAANDYQKRHKISIYLMQKGYEADLVWSAIRELNDSI